MAKTKKRISVFLLAIMMLGFGVMQANANSIEAVQQYRYDYDTIHGYAHNYHNYKYTLIKPGMRVVNRRSTTVHTRWNYHRIQVDYTYGY